MKISLFCIGKNDDFKGLCDKYIGLIKHFGEFRENLIFSESINKAQKEGAIKAQKAYTKAFEPFKKGFCVALDEKAPQLSSAEFSELLRDKNELCFFIGGAFGLEKPFLQGFDACVGLSKMTLAHSLAKLVLLEQIYRGLCIIHNHPYHK